MLYIISFILACNTLFLIGLVNMIINSNLDSGAKVVGILFAALLIWNTVLLSIVGRSWNHLHSCLSALG